MSFTACPASAQLASDCVETDLLTGETVLDETCTPFIPPIQTPDLTGLDTGPTARIRHTEHDGLKENSSGLRLDGFRINEGSIWATSGYILPGTVMGGRLRVAPYIGYSELFQKTKATTIYSQKAILDTISYGGSSVWSYQTMFIGSQFGGFNSNVKSTLDGAVTKYHLSGYTGQTTIGNTYSLGSFSLTLAASLLYSGFDSSTFDVFGNAAKLDSNTIAGQLSGTLFTTKEIVGIGTMRPFIKLVFTDAFQQNIDLKDATSKVEFEQATSFGLYEFGFDVTDGKFSYGASGYTEFSADENTFGARISASYSFQ